MVFLCTEEQAGLLAINMLELDEGLGLADSVVAVLWKREEDHKIWRY